MSAEFALMQALRDSSEVAGIVPAGRITPVKRVQATDLPAITIERITSDPVQSLAGDTSELDQVRMRVNCWADGYLDSKQMASAVRGAVRSLDSYFISDQDLYEDETQIYRVALDFYIWINPITSLEATFT